MKEGIQILLAEAGEAACYALDIIKIAERVTQEQSDVVAELERGIAEKVILYNKLDRNDPNNFFVDNPPEFLRLLTHGARWSVEKVPAEYVAKSGEYVVDRWEVKGVAGLLGHFRLPDWDSWPGSKAVMYGKIVSRRVFRRIA